MRYKLTLQRASEETEPLPVDLDDHPSWPEFLTALEEFCQRQGWDVEYNSARDEACAIFYQNPSSRSSLGQKERESPFQT